MRTRSLIYVTILAGCGSNASSGANPDGLGCPAEIMQYDTETGSYEPGIVDGYPVFEVAEELDPAPDAESDTLLTVAVRASCAGITLLRVPFSVIIEPEYPDVQLGYNVFVYRNGEEWAAQQFIRFVGNTTQELAMEPPPDDVVSENEGITFSFVCGTGNCKPGTTKGDALAGHMVTVCLGAPEWQRGAQPETDWVYWQVDGNDTVYAMDPPQGLCRSTQF